jgi:hypothetical protein
LKELGTGIEVHELDHVLIAEAIEWLRAWESR